MLIRDQEIMLPTSMVGNYPNPRWWDANFARFFTGDQHPPDSLEREALEDVIMALAQIRKRQDWTSSRMGVCRAITMPTRPSITTSSAWATTSKAATWASPSIVVCMQAH